MSARKSNSRLRGRTRSEIAELLRAGVVAFDLHAFTHAGRCDIAGCTEWTRASVRVVGQSRGGHCCERCRLLIGVIAAEPIGTGGAS